MHVGVCFRLPLALLGTHLFGSLLSEEPKQRGELVVIHLAVSVCVDDLERMPHLSPDLSLADLVPLSELLVLDVAVAVEVKLFHGCVQLLFGRVCIEPGHEGAELECGWGW